MFGDGQRGRGVGVGVGVGEGGEDSISSDESFEDRLGLGSAVHLLVTNHLMQPPASAEAIDHIDHTNHTRSATDAHSDANGTIWFRRHSSSTAIAVDTAAANANAAINTNVDAFDTVVANGTFGATQISDFDRQTNGSVKQYLLGLDATANAEAEVKPTVGAKVRSTANDTGASTGASSGAAAVGAAAASAGFGAQLSVNQVSAGIQPPSCLHERILKTIKLLYGTPHFMTSPPGATAATDPGGDLAPRASSE